MNDDWITTQDAAALSGYHIIHIRRLVKAGKIKGRKWGQSWQVSQASLLSYLHTMTEETGKRGPKP